jgi:hypothetical protein
MKLLYEIYQNNPLTIIHNVNYIDDLSLKIIEIVKSIMENNILKEQK